MDTTKKRVTKKRVTKRTLPARKAAPVKKSASVKKSAPVKKSAASSDLTKLLNNYAKAYAEFAVLKATSKDFTEERKAWVQFKVELQARLKIKNLRAPR